MIRVRNDGWGLFSGEEGTKSTSIAVRLFPFYYGWAIVAAAFIERVFSMGVYNNMGVFFKPVLADFGWTRSETALAFSMTTLFIGGIAPLVGTMVDRYGPRLFVAVEALTLATGYLLVSRMTSLWQFYFFFVLFVGVGQSVGTNTILSTLPRWFEAKRGLTQGIVQSGAGLGIALMPLPLTYLAYTYSWRLALAVAGIAIGVSVFAVAWFFKRAPQEVGALPDGRPRPKEGAAPGTARRAIATVGDSTLRQALRTWNLRKLWFVTLSAGFAHAVIGIHLVPHATDQGFSPVVAASFMAVIGFGNMVSKIIVGWASDRVGRRAALAFCFSVAAGTFILILFARETWAFYLFAAAFGFAYGGWLPLFPAIAADLFGVGSLGAIYGIMNAGSAIGGALGSFLGGYVFDITASYRIVFSAAGALLLVSIGILLSLHVGAEARTKPAAG